MYENMTPGVPLIMFLNNNKLVPVSATQEEALRMAILDYIQRCHPSDTDTYKMVSLYFTMYREIAAMLEDNANRQHKRLYHCCNA